MPRIKQRQIRSFVPKRRRHSRHERAPDPVQPTIEHLLRRAEALGCDIEFHYDPDTEKLTWKTPIDLAAAVDPLAIYLAQGQLSQSEERAGRYYALGRLVSFGPAFPSWTVIGRVVASTIGSSAAAGQTTDEEEREERRAAIMADYREADRMLRLGQPRVVRSVVRSVCLDGQLVRPHHLKHLRRGLGFLADLWRIEAGEG